MDDTYCSDCKENTVVVSDHTTGDTICSECGLVLESHLIDETSEWRTFADDSGDHDPVRVGAPTNPLLADGGLYTVITKPKPNGAKSNGVTSDALRWNRGSSNPDRALVLAFETIGNMCDKLSLVETIKYRACEIYKNVKDQKSCRGRNHDSIMAACLFIACRQEDKPRTFKEICTVVNGAKMKDIRKALKFIVKQLEGSQSMEIGTVDAGDFINRFCSKLRMKFQTNKAAQEAFAKSKEFDIRRSPLSIAAAVIYVVTQLSNDKKSLKDVSTVTEVAQGTIRSSCKDLYPHLVKIIPSWYARQDDLKNLCAS